MENSGLAVKVGEERCAPFQENELVDLQQDQRKSKE
jgi:hypothetical protein